MWINQPSLLEPLHRHHGMLGLAYKESETTARFYPIAGDIISMRVPFTALSQGWPDHLRPSMSSEDAKRYAS
jgi:hypothetical protein